MGDLRASRLDFGLPVAKHDPTGFFELPIYLPVALDIVLDFFDPVIPSSPKLAAFFPFLPVLSVPEISVAKDSYFFAMEGDIRGPDEFFGMTSVLQAKRG